MLCSGHLHNAGAELVVADVRTDAVDRVVHEFGASPSDPDQMSCSRSWIYSHPVRLARGLTTRPSLRSKPKGHLRSRQQPTGRTIADGEALRQAGIAYVPDYVVNAGRNDGRIDRDPCTEPSREASIKQIARIAVSNARKPTAPMISAPWEPPTYCKGV